MPVFRHRSAENQRTKGTARSACSKNCGTSQSNRARRCVKERCMGLGQAAREVWSRLWCDELHRSVSILLAEREAVRRRVARVVQGLEASTGVTELISDRATDDQRIVTTRSISPQPTINSHHNQWASALY